jgi:hypothetical protein
MNLILTQISANDDIFVDHLADRQNRNITIEASSVRGWIQRQWTRRRLEYVSIGNFPIRQDSDNLVFDNTGWFLGASDSTNPDAPCTDSDALGLGARGICRAFSCPAGSAQIAGRCPCRRMKGYCTQAIWPASMLVFAIRHV